MSLLKFTSVESINADYWRELGIPYDFIIDLSKSEINLNNKLHTVLNKYLKNDLEELCHYYNVDSVGKIKSEILPRFDVLNSSKKIEILLLHDFLSRKKKAIDKIFYSKDLTREKSNTSFSKLKIMFNESPINLIEILTYYLWHERGSGDKYTLNKSSFETITKFKTEYVVTFPEALHKATNNQTFYKVHSFTEQEGELIIHLYKQISDSPKPDFDKAIRNKEVTSVFIKFDKNNNLIEIKGASKKEEIYIIETIESFLDTNVRAITSEVYENYDSNKVKNAFSKGNPIEANADNDLLVSQISFRNSYLKKSPKITIQLDDESIWPSLRDAENKGVISVKSIKNIEFLVARCGQYEKKIRSKLLPNGNLIFNFDDSRMDEDERNNFNKKFKNFFGLPLLQEISNAHFQEGEIDKVDYVMSLSNTSLLSKNERNHLAGLVADELVKQKTNTTFKCKDCNNIYVLDNTTDDNFSCDCGNDEFIKSTSTLLENDLKKITKKVKEKIRLSITQAGFRDKSTTIIKVNGIEFNGISFYNENSNELIQLIVTEQNLHHTTLNRLSTMMIPTIIITAGMLETTLQNMRKQGIVPINFGRIHLSQEEEINDTVKELLETIQLEAKSMISSAADNAYQSLKTILCSPSDTPSSYNDKMFEDDVFAILKELVPNSQKWGKEKSGQAYPEGIFAMATKKIGGENLTRVYSYDCKFTRKNEGYDLNISENRKALEYVVHLNNNDYVKRFSDTDNLSAHLFISNAFKKSQIKKMEEYFYHNLDPKADTTCLFLDVETLLFLHESYRKSFLHLETNRNLFYEQLVKLFNEEIITKSTVSEAFTNALDNDLMENKVLNTQKVTKKFSEIL